MISASRGVILSRTCWGTSGPPPLPRQPVWGPRHVSPEGGLGWVGLGEGLTWSPTHGPRCLPCRTQLGGCTRVSRHKAYRTVDRPQTPRWRSWAADAAVPVCMCPCVSEGRGGGLWHTCLLHCCSALAHMAPHQPLSCFMPLRPVIRLHKRDMLAYPSPPPPLPPPPPRDENAFSVPSGASGTASGGEPPAARSNPLHTASP